ncbi:hypothetical protein MAA8898_04258 [Maliponia aquimaris]|uniref:Uncharacterized protein n=1 Tax=Maliponia aquimaris TaxID=1673631 RepID=A0A238L2Q7_9RHOB|nr:hypothetical protein MAA8898_04258 [Maliponia aquimaris]
MSRWDHLGVPLTLNRGRAWGNGSEVAFSDSLQSKTS